MSMTEARIIDWLPGVSGSGESLSAWATIGDPTAGELHTDRPLDSL